MMSPASSQKRLLFFCSLMVSNLLQGQMSDQQIVGDSIRLFKVDTGRIATKQQGWADRFAQQQSKRTMMWIGAGTATVATVAVVAYQLNKPDEHTAQADVPMSNEAFNALRAQAWQEDLAARRCPRTLPEHAHWFAKNTEKAFYGAIAVGLVSFFSGVMDSSWTTLKKTVYEMLDSGCSEQFMHCVRILFRDTTRLYDSFDLFVHAAQKLRLDDDLHQQLRASMARTVIMDNYAFVNSLEELLAFIAQIMLTQAELTYEQCYEVELSLKSLCQLTNAVLERIELVVQELEMSNDSRYAASLEKVLQGLYGELEHCMQTVGTILYGDDFALYQAQAA